MTDEYATNEHMEDCECRDCVGHDDDCPCPECEEARLIEADRMSEAEAANIWAAEQNALRRMAELIGLDELEEEK